MSSVTNRTSSLNAAKAAKNDHFYAQWAVIEREVNPQLLDIRLFEPKDKRVAYEQQTKKAKAADESNCPLCVLSGDSNKARIYKPTEMDADRVTAWSQGSSTSLPNLTLLCVTHNRAKGNR